MKKLKIKNTNNNNNSFYLHNRKALSICFFCKTHQIIEKAIRSPRKGVFYELFQTTKLYFYVKLFQEVC